MSGLFEDLRQTLTARPSGVVFIVGTGVSVGALRGSPLVTFAAWPDLLRDGLRRAHEFGDLDVPSLALFQSQLGLSSPHTLVGVADIVMRGLTAPRGGEFRRWLRETVGAFDRDIRDRAVLDAIAEHQRRGVLLATTNYDHLLESATGLKATNWRHSSDVERAIRGTEPRVIHLHGSWDDPDSIVLGTLSYADVARDPHAQAVLATLRTAWTFVFVGCGAGLQDPNLGAFLKWTGEVFAHSEARHFRLCLRSEVETLRRERSLDQRIFPLPYGDDHADLAPFLRELLPMGAARGPAPPPAAAGTSGRTIQKARPAQQLEHPPVAAPTSTPPESDCGEDDEEDYDGEDALVDDLGMLLAVDAGSFARPIARITGISEDIVRSQLQHAPQHQVRVIFKTTWPGAQQLGDYTVAQVRRWQLTGAVARVVGLPYSDIVARLADKPGQTKIRRALARQWKRTDDNDADEPEAAPESASTPEDIETKSVAFIRRHDLAWMITEITSRPRPWVQRRIQETHGKTLVPRAFREFWPDDVTLGTLTVGACVRLALAPRLARTLGVPLTSVQKHLTSAPEQTSLRALFREHWPHG